MKNVILMLVLTVFFSPETYSKNIIIDVYGAGESQSEAILKKYSTQIIVIESKFDKETIIGAINGKEDSEKMDEINTNKAVLTEKIKKDGDFLYVYIHTTTYPGENNLYTTIEVVDKSRPDRLRFISPKFNESGSSVKSDLINKMIEHNRIESDLILTGELNKYDHLCPVYHCVGGFSHPKLKPYLKIFNMGALKEKKLILDTLNQDPDPERRAGAAFLMGHFNDPKEIISILSQHINDKSALVRNDVMRVIGETMEKAKISQINVLPFLDLLDSPYGTDRNKALFVLYESTKLASSRKLIIQNGKDNLLAILRLKQPNNHEYAYMILMKISGKKYDENNFEAWAQWFTVAQNKPLMTNNKKTQEEANKM